MQKNSAPNSYSPLWKSILANECNGMECILFSNSVCFSHAVRVLNALPIAVGWQISSHSPRIPLRIWPNNQSALLQKTQSGCWWWMTMIGFETLTSQCEEEAMFLRCMASVYCLLDACMRLYIIYIHIYLHIHSFASWTVEGVCVANLFSYLS